MAYDFDMYSNPLDSDCNLDYTEKDRATARKRYENKLKAKKKAAENAEILRSKCLKARDDAIRKYLADMNFKTNLNEAMEALQKQKKITREEYI